MVEVCGLVFAGTHPGYRTASKLLSGSDLPSARGENDGTTCMAEKKWESEEQIHARIRELTGEIRQLRQELRHTPEPAPVRKPVVADRPRRRRSHSKKR